MCTCTGLLPNYYLESYTIKETIPSIALLQMCLYSMWQRISYDVISYRWSYQPEVKLLLWTATVPTSISILLLVLRTINRQKVSERKPHFATIKSNDFFQSMFSFFQHWGMSYIILVIIKTISVKIMQYIWGIGR